MTRARTLSKLGSSPAEISEGAVVAGITTIDASGFNITGVATATSFSGDGSSLSGISTAAVPGINTERHSVFNTINASGIATFASAASFAGGYNSIDSDGLWTNKVGSTNGTIQTYFGSNRMDLYSLKNGDVDTAWRLYGNGNATFNGTVTATTNAIKADAGIDFSGAQTNAPGMTSETLDSYEEGTWTPTMGYATSYGTQSGKYVKVGKTVHVWFEIEVTAFSTTTASTSITSIPFIIDKVTGCWAAVINGVSTTPDWRIGPWTAGSSGLGVWMAGGYGSASSSPILMTATSWSHYSSLTGSLGTAFTMKGGWTYISTT